MSEEDKKTRALSPRDELLSKALAAKFDGNQSELARVVDTSQQNINNFFNGTALRPAYLPRLLNELGISNQDYEKAILESWEPSGEQIASLQTKLATRPRPRVRPPGDAVGVQKQPVPLRNTPSRMLPVLGEAVGGVDGRYVFNGSILDYVACPPSLDNVQDAYCVYVDGESMSPRYRPGEVVYVHPKKPPRRGDDVIVQIHPSEDDGSPPFGYIKEFVGWQGNKLVLQQYNPNQKVEFDKEEVVSVHPIILSGKY